MHAERHRPTTALARLSCRLTRMLVLAVGLALGAGAARAQSLAELYQAARGFDATYLAARALADSAQYRVAQVEALRRPSASLGAGISRSEVDRPARAAIGSTGSDVTLSARHPLFNRADRVTIEQAYKSLDIAQAELETAEQDLIVRVAQAYFDVLAAQDTLSFTRTSKAAITEQLASAKRNFEVGTATITDTREAQARFDLATAQEIAAENDLRTRRAALDQLVGRAGVEPRPLAARAELLALPIGAVDDWLTRADAEHPDVRRARLDLDVAQLETDKAEAEHLPTVDIVGSVGGDYTNRGTLTSPSGTTRSASIGVQLNVPLYTGRSIENRVKETLVLEERSRNQLEAARRGVALATRQVFLGVQSGQAQVQALEAAESSSQLALEATQLGYKVGVRVNLDVLNAQTQLFETRRDLARARYDVLVNSLRLRQAAGTLGPEDLQPVNRLLAP